MSAPFPFDPFNAEQFEALMRAPEPGVIHHNNEAIEDIAADIVLRETLGQLPRMEYIVTARQPHNFIARDER